jgi:hypothetical protein
MIDIDYKWSPHTINPSCPVFIVYYTGHADGLGSQLEGYVFNMYLAKIARATLIVDGFIGGILNHDNRLKFVIDLQI